MLPFQILLEVQCSTSLHCKLGFAHEGAVDQSGARPSPGGILLLTRLISGLQWSSLFSHLPDSLLLTTLYI